VIQDALELTSFADSKIAYIQGLSHGIPRFLFSPSLERFEG